MGQIQLAPGRAREYETIYIMRPSIDKDAADGVANRVHDAIKGQDGTVTGVELWGRRRLAYQIQRHHRGIYVYVKYLGRGSTVAELERQLRLVDEVIRYQTIVLRTNVPIGDVQESELSLDFDLPDEPDEPDVTRERELGLDNISDHRRRDHRDRDRGEGDAAAGGGASATASADAQGATSGDASKEPSKDASAKAGTPAEAKAGTPAEAKAAAPAEAKADAPAEAKAAAPAEAKAAAPAEAKADESAAKSKDEES